MGFNLVILYNVVFLKIKLKEIKLLKLRISLGLWGHPVEKGQQGKETSAIGRSETK